MPWEVAIWWESGLGASCAASVRYRCVATSGLLTTPEAKAWTGLVRAQVALMRDVDRELRRAHDLPLSWYDVLQEVAAAPEGRIRMGELADRVMLTRAGLSGLVDRLERAGLVERRPCEGDARGTYAVTTRSGREQLERAARTHRDAVRRRYTDRFDDAELELFGRMWERIGAAGRPG
jgi:DNA-binding MarR family transcriptional regulator